MAFRGHGVKLDAALAVAVREEFRKALQSGLAPTAAATVAGVSGATGRRWAKAAGYQSNPKHCGTRYSSQVRKAFWEALCSGLNATQAAVIAGVSENAAVCWVEQAGFVPRTPFPAGLELAVRSGGALSFLERCRLEQLLEAGHSLAGPPACWGGIGRRLAGRLAAAPLVRDTVRGSGRRRLTPTPNDQRYASSTSLPPCSMRFCDA